MKIINALKAHWDHEGECFPTVSRKTVGGEYSPHLFTTKEKAEKAADKAERADRGGGMQAKEKTSPALALQLKDGRVFPVRDAGKAPSAKVQKRPKPAEWVEGSSIVSVRVTEKAVHLWNGKGNPPKKNWNKPTLVKVGDRLYSLETDEPVPLDPK